MIWGTAIAHPSLALMKYWGKKDDEANTPATGSLAVTLADLTTKTRIALREYGPDVIKVDGEVQEPLRYQGYLARLKDFLGWSGSSFWVESSNDFPTAAGLASSSSGFAALTGAAFGLAQGLGQNPPDLTQISSLARWGSGSATRSVWGGFTLFPAGAEVARSLHPQDFWPDFRILVGLVSRKPKATSSRGAMETSRRTSPYYAEWVKTSPALLLDAQDALAARDWSRLGPLIRQSYLRMFATMFTSDPPLIFWQPLTLQILHNLEELRREGFNVWETMDAGPQVKVFCPDTEAGTVQKALQARIPEVSWLLTAPGAGLEIGHEETHEIF